MRNRGYLYIIARPFTVVGGGGMKGKRLGETRCFVYWLAKENEGV